MAGDTSTTMQGSGERSLLDPGRDELGRHRSSQFRGRGAHAIDDKGRLTLPAQMRRAIAEGGNLVILDGRVVVWDEPTYQEALDALHALVDADELTIGEVRAFTSHTHLVTPDAQGRIVIPQSVRIEAGLERDVLVLGAGARIEILPMGDASLDETAAVTDAVVDALDRGRF